MHRCFRNRLKRGSSRRSETMVKLLISGVRVYRAARNAGYTSRQALLLILDAIEAEKRKRGMRSWW